MRTQSAKWISSSLNASFRDAVTRFSTAFPSSIDSTTIPVGMLRKNGDGNTSFTRSAFA